MVQLRLDRCFASRGTNVEGNLIFHLSLKDYADVKGEELVTYRLGVMRSRETLAQLVSEGRSTSIQGRMLGKLRKARLDDLAPVERKPNLERLQ